MPFSDSLLDHARARWKDGDWQGLGEIAVEKIESHPERAKLALLAASGHFGLGDFRLARHFSELAMHWGCGRKLLARVLIAGTHNTLARAAAATGKQRDRALRHFDASVAIGLTGTADGQVSRRRLEFQIGQMGLTTELAALRHSKPTSPIASAAPSPIRELAEQIKAQNASLAVTAKTQQSELVALRKHLESALKKEISNATRQLEAYVALQASLGSDFVLPAMHGWAISPDLALFLVETVRAREFDAVVEFGSGTSTLLIAKALDISHKSNRSRRKTMQVAFEHLEEYEKKTAALLHSAGLRSNVELTLSPLTTFRADNGDLFPYYDCQSTLRALADRLKHIEVPRLFVVVDGPPGSTAPLARYPALQVLLRALPTISATVVLDDSSRPDEREVAQRWIGDLFDLGYSPRSSDLPLEKGARVIDFDTSAPPSRGHRPPH
jgi:hypothetical protein